MQRQQSALDEEIYMLRLRLKTLSVKLTTNEKDNGVCNFFEGDFMQDVEPKYMCFECNCGKVFKSCDGRPAAKNVVTHDASHILNRGADYYWCSRKAIKKVGQSVTELSPQKLAEYRKHCNFLCLNCHPLKKQNNNEMVISIQ
ncbi:hypothetical protein GHT06_013465 [Daphnia sinensis]|uniref:Uncharacterized protein n=1 Tax=Daphnia sinensis TaxID=1820382 RepID=A0AAD5LKL4_9CRUS|nr:hypothetical protein GHT06_013465 [Daphnia sinensis]